MFKKTGGQTGIVLFLEDKMLIGISIFFIAGVLALGSVISGRLEFLWASLGVGLVGIWFVVFQIFLTKKESDK